MLSAITNAVPLEYLIPIGIVGSLNKRVIFPIAAWTADYITTKYGVLSPEEAHEQHMIFDNTLQAGANTVGDTIEQTLINQAKAIPIVGEYIPDIAPSEPVSKEVPTSTPKEPKVPPKLEIPGPKKAPKKATKKKAIMGSSSDGFVPYGEGLWTIQPQKQPRPYDKKLYEQLMRAKEEQLAGNIAAKGVR